MRVLFGHFKGEESYAFVFVFFPFSECAQFFYGKGLFKGRRGKKKVIIIISARWQYRTAHRN
jgi:hypothetical protein